MMLGENRAMSRFAASLVLCAAALALSGCESARSLNPFAEKDVVVPGERRPAFGADSGFDGPRKLPPPNSDYVGATMRADEPVPPRLPTTDPAALETAPGVGAAPAAGTDAASAPAAPPSPSSGRPPLPVPPPPQ